MTIPTYLSILGSKETYVDYTVWNALRTTNYLFVPADEDNPQTFAMDSAEGSGSDPAQISIAGLITFNAKVRYELRIAASVDKLTATDDAVLFCGLAFNGVLDANTTRLVADLNNPMNVVPFGTSHEGISVIGETIEVQFWTDSVPDASDLRLKGTTSTLNLQKTPCIQIKMNIKTIID